MNRWIVCVALASIVGCAKPDPPKEFRPSKETTFITEPLDKDGYLDYETALNERLRGKITPETNANALFWQVIGPKPEGGEVHPDYFKWLQTDRPPDDGTYYVNWPKFAKGRGSEKTDQELLDERHTRLGEHPWTAKEEPECAAWLEANSKPLDVARRASLRKEYFNPLVSRNDKNERGPLIGSLLQSLQRLREVAGTLAKRAMKNTGEGQFDEAWADLMTARRLGRLIARGGTLIEMLVGIAIDDVANRATPPLIDRMKPNARKALKCLEEIQSLPPLSTVAEKIELSERFTLLDIIQSTRKYGFDALRTASDGKTPEPPDAAAQLLLDQIDWEIIFRTASSTYDRVGKILSQSDRPTRQKQWLAFETELRQQRKDLGDNTDISKIIREGGRLDKAVSEKIAKIIVTLLFPAADRIQRAADNFEQRHRNLQLLLALAAYRADHGKYPPRLADLAPKYLPKIPDDLFSGKPLVYKPTADGYLLYSVGENGTDDGGASFGDDPRGDDLTVRMPPK